MALPLTLSLQLPLTLTLPLSLTLLTLTSTQEDGSGWAAQRTGRRLVVGGLRKTGDGAPGREHARRDPFSGCSVDYRACSTPCRIFPSPVSCP